ncbi:hypothetical protein PIB30_087090 [Stylosanthes scabra]|uniref:Uncharacterized protein n=1 Tax=Stylosanthes scabra TaxID=79078 RepID=A0ABU6VRS0_9FABA|nr:hypothetical protein [Stylosanthes scabra]
MLYACGAIVQGKAWRAHVMRELPHVIRGQFNVQEGLQAVTPRYTVTVETKPIIELDPEIEKTLKKNRSRVKPQRALQFDQQEANSDEDASEKFSEEEIVEENSEEEIQHNMADNANNQRRTLVDYTNPTTASCGSSIVWPTVTRTGPTSSSKPVRW